MIAPPKLPPNCSSVRGSFRGGIGVEIVSSIELIAIAAKGKGGAVDRVGSRLQSNIDDRARFPSIFGRRIFLNVEFLDRIDGQNGGGISGDARAVDDALAGEWLAVKEPIDEISVVFRAQAVGAGSRESAAGITHHAGTQLQQIFVVAAVQRQVVDFLVAERSAQSGGSGIDQGNLFLDDYRFGNFAGLKREVGAHVAWRPRCARSAARRS